jgi:ParB family chromosome partitioning protein
MAMNEDSQKRRLGRGLAALIGEMDKPAEAQSRGVSADGRVPIEFLSPNPRNPRRRFPEEELHDLAQSIREHGLVQPVVVRPTTAPERYEIVAGERRWRAAQIAGLAEIPVIIRDVDDRVALEIAIVENVQRSDLNPIEEAEGYDRLMRDHNYTQAELGQVIGKSRSHVANTLRLLKLPPAIRDMIQEGALSAGHARALVTVENPVTLAKRIIDEGLSVRQTEALAQKHEESAAVASGKNSGGSARRHKDADTEALERLLTDVTGLKVSISHRDPGGEIRIAYRNLEQLDELCRRLQH